LFWTTKLPYDREVKGRCLGAVAPWKEVQAVPVDKVVGEKLNNCKRGLRRRRGTRDELTPKNEK
jgi:hypothetical protein